MPSFEFTSPEGKKYTVNGPDGSTKEQAFQMLQAQLSGPAQKKTETGLVDDIKQGIGNLAAGAVRGAGSIGATLLAPIDIANDAMAGKGLSLESNRQRRADIDAGLQSLGADPESTMYKGGKLVGEIAGTAGAGGLVARGAASVPGVAAAAPNLLKAIQTSGMTAGGTRGAVNALTRATGGAISGGVSAGLVNPDDALTGAAIGGALPGVALAAGKAGGAIRNGLTGGGASPDVAALAQRANELDITIPADRIVNSKPLNALAATLDYVPFSGRAATVDKMESGLNRALSRTFGQDSDNVTMALRKAQEELGSKFDDVLKNNTVKIDDEFLQSLIEHEQRIKTELPFNTAKHVHAPLSGNVLKNQIDMILEKGATGEIDGQTAYNIKRTLDRMSKPNTPEAYYAREIKDSLMGALDRSLGQEEAAGFAVTRQQYGNMRALEKIAQNGAEGGVSVARMANMKNINNPQLQELADIAAQFVKTRESQHGAMQRAVVGATTGIMGGVPGLAAGAAVGRGANMALNSNALKNALLNPAGQPSAGLLKLIQGGYRVAPILPAR